MKYARRPRLAYRDRVRVLQGEHKDRLGMVLSLFTNGLGEWLILLDKIGTEHHTGPLVTIPRSHLELIAAEGEQPMEQ